jgi:hypothetical protein
MQDKEGLERESAVGLLVACCSKAKLLISFCVYRKWVLFSKQSVHAEGLGGYQTVALGIMKSFSQPYRLLMETSVSLEKMCQLHPLSPQSPFDLLSLWLSGHFTFPRSPSLLSSTQFLLYLPYVSSFNTIRHSFSLVHITGKEAIVFSTNN